MTNRIIVREATFQEADTISALIEEIAVETYSSSLESNVRAWAQTWHSSEKVMERITSDNTLQLIAEEDKSIVGAAYALAHDGIHVDYCNGFLGGLYLRPKVRNQGVGRTLQAQRLDWLATKEVSIVGTTVSKGNAASENLVTSHGFILHASEPGEMMPDITWDSYKLEIADWLKSRS